MNWLRSSRLTSVHIKCFLVRKVYHVKHRKTKQDSFHANFPISIASPEESEDEAGS